MDNNFQQTDQEPTESKKLSAVNIIASVCIVVLIAIISIYLLFFASKENTKVVMHSPAQDLPKEESFATGQDLAKKSPTLKLITKDEYLLFANTVKTTPKDISHEESVVLKKHPEVKRLNDQCIEINLKNGKVDQLCDSGSGGPDTTRYSFNNYLKGFGYYFDVLLWEGSGGLLINEQNGERIQIFRYQVVSNDGTQLLTYNSDFSEAEYDPTGLNVFRKAVDSLVLATEYSFDPISNLSEAWEMTNPVWVSNNSIYFIKRNLNLDSALNRHPTDEYFELSF